MKKFFEFIVAPIVVGLVLLFVTKYFDHTESNNGASLNQYQPESSSLPKSSSTIEQNKFPKLNNEPEVHQKQKNSERSNYPISEKNEVISVLEEQVFELCGYKKFTAKIIKKIDGKLKINILSRDREVPGSTIRGYEKSFPIEKNVKLWPNCTVSFKLENLASTKRIVISLLRR